MKSIALRSHESAHHASFWNLFRGFFHVPFFHGITGDPARSSAKLDLAKSDTPIFENEDELEDYIRSFRD